MDFESRGRVEVARPWAIEYLRSEFETFNLKFKFHIDLIS
jgi:hypothetical protein